VRNCYSVDELMVFTTLTITACTDSFNYWHHDAFSCGSY